MRLYSIHPKYLDQKGLCGLWAESLLAQSCLIKGEYTECKKCLGVGKYDEFNNTKEWQRFIICDVCKGTGKIKTSYYNHPQLFRFKQQKEHDLLFLSAYLWEIWKEGQERGYNFIWQKIWKHKDNIPEWVYNTLTVTKGQLVFEINHLQKKLKTRDNLKFKQNNKTLCFNSLKSHPLFKIIDGKVESWEKIK